MKWATERIRGKTSCGPRETDRKILLRSGCPQCPYCPWVLLDIWLHIQWIPPFCLSQFEWFSFLAFNKFQSRLQIHKVSKSSDELSRIRLRLLVGACGWLFITTCWCLSGALTKGQNPTSLWVEETSRGDNSATVSCSCSTNLENARNYSLESIKRVFVPRSFHFIWGIWGNLDTLAVGFFFLNEVHRWSPTRVHFIQITVEGSERFDI